MNSEFTKKSKYQRKIKNGLSQCLICERKCKILQGKSGFCGTRVNIDGEINTIVSIEETEQSSIGGIVKK